MPINQIQKKEDNSPATMYQHAVNIGTEEITQEDLNTPVLKIVQPNTQEIDNKRDGYFYRSDLREQFESVEVNLVYVTTAEGENYNRTAKEKFKIYFGFYKGTNEPFKMYIRGWALNDHRVFQTEVVTIKNKYKVPMLALSVKLTTQKQTGIIQDTGKSYTTYRPVFTVEKEDGKPVIEMDSDRITFLVDAAERFQQISKSSLITVADDQQNEIPAKEATSQDNAEPEVDIDSIPF